MAYVEKRGNGFLAIWRDESGKRHSRIFKPNDTGNPDTLVTPEQAEAKARAFASSRTGAEPRARRTLDGLKKQNQLDGFVDIWSDPEREPQYVLTTYLKSMIERDEIRDSTRELYLRTLRVHITNSELGRTDVRSITPQLLSDFWATIPATDVGTRRNVYQLLSKALNRAIRSGLIDVNPLKRAPDVKRPARGRKEEVDPLTATQVEALADAATSARDRLEILVMAYGGLRAGEVGGLRSQDIANKGDRCQLRLRQQVVRVTGKGQYIEKIKTDAGRRVVDIPCSVADELKAFIKGNTPAEDGRVFHGANGAMRAHNAILHGVKMAGKRAGLPNVFSHQLRHTAVSFWIEDGANPKDIQRMVGHASIRETMDTYGHLFDYGGRELAEGMERRRQQVKQDSEKS